MAFDRAAALARLESGGFDVLVIGGGITGCGVALDAATRGLEVALVERDDFASGTSSKSSKLFHGGLRYLQQKEIRLVYDALYERQRALRNAPHLVRVLPFLIPVLSRDGLINPKVARALGSALWMYDLTGGARIRRLHRRIDKETALAHMPTLREANVAAAYLYYDAQADDARYTLTVARTAAAHGAAVANHAGVTALHRDPRGRVTGATVRADGRELTVLARTVVNAAGVFSDEVRELDEGAHPHSIRPAKGIHIAVPWEKVRNDVAVIVPVPKDRRSIFVVPWGDFTYIGTTDTDYDGPIDDPQCTPEDVRYLLDAMNLAMRTPLTEDDVVGTWAGLRPLVIGGTVGQKTADLSRRHKVAVGTSGMITITGGKLTTYRKMAEDTVDTALEQLGRRIACRTKTLALLGADGPMPDDEHLERRYGSMAADVLALEHGGNDLAEPLVP
jgi:glycerol-3-phosphate dehydrogenase